MSKISLCKKPSYCIQSYVKASSIDDSVDRATKKARGMFFLPKAILRNPDPEYFPPLV